MRSTDLRLDARAVLGVAKKDLRILARYPLESVNSIFQPVYQFLIPSLLLGATFFVAGRPTGLEASAGTGDLAGFLITGMVVAYVVGAAFWGIAHAFKREMDQATLEPQWLTPAAREVLVVGRAVTAMGLAGIGAAIMLVLGVVLFGARISPEIVVALPAFLLGVVAVVGVSFLISSAVLLIKEPTFFVDATDFLFSGFTGVAFPIAVFPGLLQLISFALPTTYALDLLRVSALGTTPLVPPVVAYGALFASVAILLPLGRAAFGWTDRRLREQGTVGQH